MPSCTGPRSLAYLAVLHQVHEFGGQRLRHADGPGVGQRDDGQIFGGSTTKFAAAPSPKGAGMAVLGASRELPHVESVATGWPALSTPGVGEITCGV